MTTTHTTRPASIDEIAAEMDRRGAVIERLEADIIRKDEVLVMALDRLGIASRELTETHRVVLRGRAWGQAAMERIKREGKLPDLVADCRKANERVAVLEAALKPFAEEAENWHDDVPDDYRSLCTEPGSGTAHPGSETAFTIGDLRHARALLPHKEARS